MELDEKKTDDCLVDDKTEGRGRVAYQRSPRECYAKKICVCCGKSAAEFRDVISREEYRKIVMCQECQDLVFG